ncbi:MAG: hypothetical protein AMJ95_10775 [Omnitrophica WOR_2 bacterium SM23_72]|nr:MAG: hypothetical protein AMJ95_10775 [Omnitrophica WOR_2 bacterium SM23_72]
MSKKILIADDDELLVKAIVSRLRQYAYEAIYAYDATLAMEMAVSQKPDLILLDIKMPAGTGKSTLEHLKDAAKTTNIPVIVMTAFPDEELRHFAASKGAVDFLEKPFEIDCLLDSIKRALGEENRTEEP